MAAPHIRQGEHRFGCFAHGRAHAAHSRHGRTDSDERAQESKEEADGGQTHLRKKADAVRLCADDLLTRERLAAYHDSYSAAMAKYGLQSGVRGSEARHTTTAQYYRDLKRQTGELEANVRQLQTEQQQAKAALVAKVGSLLGSGKLKELEVDNRTLQGEIAARDESIELLQQQMERQQEEHSRQLMELQAKHPGKWRTRKRNTKRKCHS